MATQFASNRDNDYFSMIRINPDVFQRDILVNRGLAQAYARAENRESQLSESQLALIASSYARAGSSALLLQDAERASSCFVEAADYYNRLGSPFSAAVICLSSDPLRGMQETVYYWLDRFATLQEYKIPYELLAYVILAYTVSRPDISADQMNIMRRSLEPYRTHAVGVLGVPVGNLLDLGDAMNSDQARNTILRSNSPLVEALAPIFSTYSAAIKQAQNDIYHWQRLALPFHPASPDIVSIIRMVDVYLSQRFDYRVSGITENLPMQRNARVIINTILDTLSRM